ncbi:MAG TPA: ATP-binding protein [Polyangia bacterium]|nr:ATP-binding protein [Polyangia bacterium]
MLLSPERLAAARRYALSVLAAIAVTFGRLRLDPWMGHTHNRHLFFLPTVMLISWLWGFGPGLVGATIFGVALRVFWTPPESFVRANSDIALFLLVSVAICVTIRSLQRARQRADAATHSRERLLAVVAHDLSNPLHAVRLAEERLRFATRDAPAVERSLKTIRHATTRMEHLLRDLVDTTRIEHDELVVTLRTEPVAEVVQEVAQIFAPQAQELGITLDVVAPSADCVIECDRDRLMQILGNLLGNALKFTPDGGRISLRALERDDGVRFEIEDSGTGIRPEHLPYIFERFRSFDARGTGLGLFIARTLVAAHSGVLSVRSRLGQGSIFWFEVPRRPGQEPTDIKRRSAPLG